MKRVGLVLFDLDGTLTTHKTGAWEAISEYAGECTRNTQHTHILGQHNTTQRGEQDAWTSFWG